MAERSCDVCGKRYEARRASSKYCSSSCRARKSLNSPAMSLLPAVSSEPVSDLFSVTLATLAAVDRVDTVAGQQALTLARRMGSPHETGAAVASLSRQLSVVMAEALDGTDSKADVIDVVFGAG